MFKRKSYSRDMSDDNESVGVWKPTSFHVVVDGNEI